jgi:hypothetical protein
VSCAVEKMGAVACAVSFLLPVGGIPASRGWEGKVIVRPTFLMVEYLHSTIIN